MRLAAIGLQARQDGTVEAVEGEGVHGGSKRSIVGAATGDVKDIRIA